MSKEKSSSAYNKIGLIAFAVFYLVSCFMVMFYRNNDSVFLGKDTKVIRFAHWNLEDGFREGFDIAIAEFEKLKAEEGVNVKVVQTTVPVRGYTQWMMTQLISNEPADVMKYLGGSDLLNEYFLPLSDYVGKPNPFNSGTPLENMAWKDSFIDGMSNALDPVYSEYFGIGTYFHTYRVFVNVDLVEEATGSKEMPRTVKEWVEICEKIKKYAEKAQKPIIPIGVRGFDKSTISNLFTTYLAQLNGNLNDHGSIFCDSLSSLGDNMREFNSNQETRERILATTEVIRELGQYFGEGFTATDLEQTKFLFFSGNVAFFPEGTWNGYSMVNNSPFPVKVISLPVIGNDHKFSHFYTGELTEQGTRVGGNFAIPKSTKHFDLALEFLQFITSYRMNQLIMEKCKWPPAVRFAKYEGLMKDFQPILSGYRRSVEQPFSYGWNTKSQRKMLESLEHIVVDNVTNPQELFMQEFKRDKSVVKAEVASALVADQRSFLELSGHQARNSLSCLREDISAKESLRVAEREVLSFENYTEKLRNVIEKQILLEEYDKIEEL